MSDVLITAVMMAGTLVACVGFLVAAVMLRSEERKSAALKAHNAALTEAARLGALTNDVVDHHLNSALIGLVRYQAENERLLKDTKALRVHNAALVSWIHGTKGRESDTQRSAIAGIINPNKVN